MYVLFFYVVPVLVTLFATALFRMAKSGHTHQAKLASDR